MDVTYFILCSSEIFISIHKGRHSLENLLFISESWSAEANVQKAD